MALVRLMGIALIIMTVVFASLWFYARAARREKLEATWDMQQGPGTRESFIQAELMGYEKPLRQRLIWGVYIVPSCLLAVLIYLTNAA
ncbi:MAG: hypothetical protein ABJL72_15090 [Roseobacter sp.]